MKLQQRIDEAVVAATDFLERWVMETNTNRIPWISFLPEDLIPELSANEVDDIMQSDGPIVLEAAKQVGHAREDFDSELEFLRAAIDCVVWDRLMEWEQHTAPKIFDEITGFRP